MAVMTVAFSRAFLPHFFPYGISQVAEPSHYVCTGACLFTCCRILPKVCLDGHDDSSLSQGTPAPFSPYGISQVAEPS